LLRDGPPNEELSPVTLKIEPSNNLKKLLDARSSAPPTKETALKETHEEVILILLVMTGYGRTCIVQIEVYSLRM